jgi:hypothetical protein
MPITFEKENDNEGKGSYLVTERLFVNADKSKIVPEDSPEAAFLLATPGKRLSAQEAAKYGLKAKSAAPENKAKAAPEETKAKKGK